ncbi:MAG: polyprenyl synthetase family protein [Abditibacteriota bacterium]|nr:polyprenyl synthetase family protein [Abditibacteriota bacterium]
MTVDLMSALAEREKKVSAFFAEEAAAYKTEPPELRDLVYAYANRGGKRLRPSVMMWCCGAMGGKEEDAFFAACGTELFHTWTLVHDDVIDNDDMRRNGPTAHKMGESFARANLGFDDDRAKEYGVDLAILTGDVLHGRAVELICRSSIEGNVSPEVTLAVVRLLETKVVDLLLSGETLDVRFEGMAIEDVSEEDIIDMMRKKTGVLYEFAAAAGAMIGLGTGDMSHKYVRALETFAGKCGIAFQLRDDILGIAADEKKLGKPIGSDIYEGKRTVIVRNALKNMGAEEKEFLLSVLGNRDASKENVERAIRLIKESGALDYTAAFAEKYVNDALEAVNILPESEYKDLLVSWARYMTGRTF